MIKCRDLAKTKLMGDVSQYVRMFENNFKTTRDPVHVFSAIMYCGSYDFPYPEWVQEYINDIAVNLLMLENSGKNFYQDVTNVLGLKQSSVGTANRITRNNIIFYAITKLRKEKGMTVESATTEVAKKVLLAESTVTDIYKKERSARKLTNRLIYDSLKKDAEERAEFEKEYGLTASNKENVEKTKNWMEKYEKSQEKVKKKPGG